MFGTVDRSTRCGALLSFTAGGKHGVNWTVVSDGLDSAGEWGGAKMTIKVSTVDGSAKFFGFNFLQNLRINKLHL